MLQCVNVCVCVCVCVYARARACVRLCAYARVKRCVRFGMQAQDVLVVNCDFIFDVCGCVDVCVRARARAGLCVARVCAKLLWLCVGGGVSGRWVWVKGVSMCA